MAKNTTLLEAGKFLMREGEESNTMYLIVKGQLEVLKRKGDIEKPIGQINEGDLVGEISFLDNSPRSASVRALTNSEILPIPRESFEETF
ncbi:MAG: cyclic nucleotide-binding domain-containing protein [Bdellovibrionota bacterium]|nr:cyclic nucleotide-binding domain-containing protein [Bdellovibrionota bacterium]